MFNAPSFFGGDSGITYEQLQERKRIARELMGDQGQIRTIGEGINQASGAIAGALMTKKAAKEEARQRDAFNTDFNAAIGGLLGGGYTPRGSSMGGSTGTPAQPISAGPGGTSEGLTPQAKDQWNAMMTPARVDSPDALDEREILARTIQMEAGNQGPEGMLGVGAVMDNRRKGGQWGDDFRSVALARGQFSPWNSVTGYAGGEQGSMAWQNPASQEAYQIADAVLSGKYTDPTGGATHFVNHDISNPSWASRMSSKGKIGAHTFYGAGPSGELPGAGGGGVQVAQAGGVDPSILAQLSGLASNPYASEGQQAIVNALIGQQMQRMQPPDPIDELRRQKMQLEIDALQNPQTKPADQTSLIQNYEYATNILGMTPDEARAWVKGGQTINVGGDGRMGTIPQGYTVVDDPSTASGYRMVPITGGPEDTSKEDAKAAEQKTQGANIVLDEIGIAKELIGGESMLSPATGITGKIASTIDSTRAGKLKNRLETIKANIGFDKLQSMRDASPTGGALGQVSEFENRLLQAVFGSLEQAQDGEDIIYNLERLEGVYNRIINEGIPDEEARQLYREIELGERAKGTQGKSDAKGGMTFEQFKADPDVVSAAEANGLTVEQLWEAWQ